MKEEMVSCSGSCCKNQQSLPLYIRLCLFVLGAIFAYILATHDTLLLLGGREISDNLWIILLLGLVASVSTCLATTGGVIIAYTELTVGDDDTTASLWGHQLFLHGGRVVGFFIIGGLLGVLGQKISYTLGVTTWLNIIVALFLLLIGVQILELLPQWKVAHKWSEKLHRNIERQGKKWRITSLFGIATCIIPCGFTQLVQLMALTSGSWISGGLLLGVFALGTLPGLLFLGVGTSLAKVSHKQYFEKIIAVILIAFSLSSLWGTIGLLGRQDGIKNNTMQSVSSNNAQREVIRVSHDGLELIPKTITIEAGKNYTIIIEPISDGLGCMSTIVLPGVDKNIYPIIAGEEIRYTIENAQKGKYTFVCSSMGMSQGKIIVQ